MRAIQVPYSMLCMLALAACSSGNATLDPDVGQMFSLQITAAQGGKLHLDGALLEGGWQGSLAPTRLDTRVGSWELAEPVSVRWSKASGGFAMQAHCWRSQKTRICPGQLRWDEAGSGSLEVSGDMGFLAVVMPQGVSVEGDLDLQLDGTWHQGSGFTAKGASQTRGVLITRDFGQGESVNLGWDKGAIDIDYGAEGLRLDWRIQRDGRQVLGANVLLPQQRDGPLSGTLSLDSLQLSTLSPLLPLLSTLEGSITGQLQLAGTVNDPLAQGDISLTGGKLALVGNPTLMEALELDIAVRGNRAQLRGEGLLGGGKLQLRGELVSDPQWQLALSILGENQNILPDR